MLDATINYLFNIADEALRARNPRLFLDRFSPFHARFHMQNIRDLGFLTFHWCVIYYFRIIGLDRAMNIMPYTINDFSTGGRFFTGNSFCSNWLSSAPSPRSVNDLILYSWQLELCHNDWHMAIETRTGTPMMDPYVNIYYPAFWNLHFFLNLAFEDQLNQYKSNIGGSSLATAYQVIQDIDRRYLGAIQRI